MDEWWRWVSVWQSSLAAIERWVFNGMWEVDTIGRRGWDTMDMYTTFPFNQAWVSAADVHSMYLMPPTPFQPPIKTSGYISSTYHALRKSENSNQTGHQAPPLSLKINRLLLLPDPFLLLPLHQQPPLVLQHPGCPPPIQPLVPRWTSIRPRVNSRRTRLVLIPYGSRRGVMHLGSVGACRVVWVRVGEGRGSRAQGGVDGEV